MDSDSSEQQCKGLTKCDSYNYYCSILKSCPFVKVAPLYLRTTTLPAKIQINARACHPKSKIVPTSRLSLSAPARVHGELSRGNEGRGALEPILEESARRNKKKKLDILKCRDSDAEADTVQKIFPTHGLGFVTHYFMCIYSKDVS